MSDGHVKKSGLPCSEEDVAVSQSMPVVTCNMCRRNRPDTALGQDDKTAYQVWVVLEVRPADQATAIPAICSPG
jgi:hypothetical protein